MIIDPQSYKLGIASDMQVGSIYGLLPPGFVGSAGAEIRLNPGQAYLWECWEDFCSRLALLDLDVVVVNGDVVEGKQPKQHASELALPLVADQLEAAEKTLLRLKRAAPQATFYGVQGTEYHVGDAGEREEILFKSLGFSAYSGLGSGTFCKEVLDLDIKGVHLNIAHHVSVSTGLYKASAIDREGAFASLATHDKIHCIVRSHIHNFNKTEYRRRHNVVCPCWQLQTRFMRHKSVHRMIPDLGGLVIHCDPGALGRGEDPIFVQKLMYDLPPQKPTKPKLREKGEKK